MVNVHEIKNGLRTGESFSMEKEIFPLDLKKCAKTYIKGGINVYIDSPKFNELKKKDIT